MNNKEPEINETIDMKIKELLNSETDNLILPDKIFSNIEQEIKTVKLMEKKKKTKFKSAAAAVFICFFIGTTCSAASKISKWSGSSNVAYEKNEFPEIEEIKEKSGIKPKYLKEFKNGFSFVSYNFSNVTGKDDSDNTLTKLKELDIYYKKDGDLDNQKLFFSAREKSSYESENLNSKDVEMYKGIAINYDSHKMKTVTDDYKITEEENKSIENGELIISYGGKGDTGEHNIQFVSWVQNNIKYSILNMSYENLTKEELINMAEEIIDKED